MEKKKVLEPTLLKTMINILDIGIMIKCMEWEFIFMIMETIPKNIFISENLVKENSTESENLSFYKIKMIKKDPLFIKVFGKMEKKVDMESIFMGMILQFIMKVIGKMI